MNTQNPGAPDSNDFRLAMRHLAGGVSVITVGAGAEQSGMTVTSVSSLSADPPTLLFCVNRKSSTWPLLRKYKAFCVNFLSAEQEIIAQNFAGFGGLAGAERYRDGHWSRLATGAPVCDAALASVDCILEEAIERHTHSLIIGRVQAIRTNPGAQPLIYWNGGYTRLSGELA